MRLDDVSQGIGAAAEGDAGGGGDVVGGVEGDGELVFDIEAVVEHVVFEGEADGDDGAVGVEGDVGGGGVDEVVAESA